MAVPLHVLLLEDRADDAALELYELRRAGFEPVWQRVDTEAAYLAALDPGLDLILADYALPQFDALRALELLRDRALDIPFIIVSGTIGEEIAVRAMQLGAADYLLKDRLTRLGAAVQRAIEQRQMRAEVQRAQLALQATAQLSQSVLSSLKAEIAVLDSSGTIIAVNEAWLEFARRNANPLLHATGVGVNYFAVCRRAAASGDKGAAQVLEGLLAVLAGEQGHYTQEYPCPTPDGLLWFLLNVTPLADEGGLVVAHEEITERKRAEEARLSAELKYRTLVEHIPAIIYIAALDKTSSTLYVNPQIEHILGFSTSEWLGDPQRWLKQLHPLDLDAVLAGVERTQAGAGPIRSEFRMIARDGRVMWFRDEAVLVRDGAGQPRFVQGVMLDITERKQAEQALLESEERYRLITENSGDLISMTDHDGRFVYASPSFRQVLGYDPAALTGALISEIVHPDDVELVLTALAAAAVQPTSIVVRLRHAEGGWRWIEGHATAVIRHGAHYFVGMGRDITERRRLEAQFLQSQKMESVGQLAGGVAHDFNNLLTAINGYAEFAMADLPPDSELRADLEEIVKAADRAAVLTRQLLTFARKQAIEPRIIDVNELIGGVEKLLRRLLGEGIILVTELASNLGQVKADPGQLEQVLVNMAINARDAMPQGGTLVISTRNLSHEPREADAEGGDPSGSSVLIMISDSGCGMDAETQQRVFEPFFTTKGPGRGTGLGLSTCYGIVKQHGGSITVASELGRGSTFTISLPSAREPAKQSFPQAQVGELPRGSEHILVAEDNPAVRTLAVRILREQGYTVLEAADGPSALLLAQTLHDLTIDLLLTDLVMPNMGGAELFQQLSARWPALKVIFVTGYNEHTIGDAGAGGQDVALLHKPFSTSKLTRIVREVLDAAGPESDGRAEHTV
jgi:two-component system cell cycle sensor histidine kinase/response regulator CckA